MMQQLQQSIAVICADATKAYIRSDVNETISAASATQQENQHEHDEQSSSSSSKQIYNFLADHFQKLAETKQREQKIAVSRKGVEEVFKWFLEDLMMKKKQNEEESPFTFSSSSSEKTKTTTFQEASKGISLQAYHTILSTSATPRVNQREITSMLESKNIIINTSALPEVFELARALQQVMQKRLKNNVEMLLKVSKNENTIDAKTVENACSSSSSTFGTTNSLLFLAVFSSLLSVKSLFELLSIIIENCKSNRRLIQLICVTFAAIDVENKNVWNAVVLLLGRSSFSSKSLFSVSDLVEQIPSIETMGHGRASTFVDDVEEELFDGENSSKTKQSKQEQQGPVVVSYDPDDEEGDGRREEQENSDDDDAEEQQEEEEDASTNNDFWAGLTSGPAS